MQKPSCQDDQVLIKVDCAVLNPSDVLFLSGKTNQPKEYPFTPGWEGAGTIVEVGKAVDASWVGKRVGFNRQNEQEYKTGGAMAEFCVTRPRECIPLRDETTLEQGVALFVNPLSALCMIHRC